MVHKPKVYWEHFGRFADKTKAKDIVAPGVGAEFKQISVHQRTLQGESGNDSDKSTIHYGSKYDEQIGHAVGVQEGNKTSIQTGWSNSLLQGFSFSTTLGQSTSTTVGNSFSNHTGFKYTGFFGPEMSVLVSMGFKITGSPYWEVGKAVKYEVGTRIKCAVAEQETLATKISTIAGQQISTLTGFKQVVGGAADAAAVSFSLKSASKMDLKAQFLNLYSSSVTRVSGTEAVVFGSAKLRLSTPGQATLNGAVIRVG